MSECKCDNPECTGDPCLCQEQCDCKVKEEKDGEEERKLVVE